MIINHNMSSMNATRMFNVNVSKLGTVSEKLASGMRINRAADDAAGLAVSEKMRTQIRGLSVASRNVQDAVSLIQTAEGYMAETTALLQRMRELSVQAANGVYTQEDRSQIQVEVNQLVEEVDRIAAHAEFNEIKILQGAFDKAGEGDIEPMYENGGMPVQIGANMDQTSMVTIRTLSAAKLGLAEGAPAPQPAQDGTTAPRAGAVDVTNITAANTAIESIDQAMQIVSSQRADLGAFQNRLEHAQRGIDYAVENLQAAESRIRDTDMAKMMADYVKDSILSQASVSMVAQANVQPQMVLQLLS